MDANLYCSYLGSYYGASYPVRWMAKMGASGNTMASNRTCNYVNFKYIQYILGISIYLFAISKGC